MSFHHRSRIHRTLVRLGLYDEATDSAAVGVTNPGAGEESRVPPADETSSPDGEMTPLVFSTSSGALAQRSLESPQGDGDFGAVRFTDDDRHSPGARTSFSNISLRSRETSRVDFKPEFTLSTEVAQRFNAYAAAAFPYEIGGLLRVVQRGDDWEAVDLHVFHQRVSPIYFELDSSAVAEFNMSLFRDGKKDEIPQWRALIHSHPQMTPHMSGPDRENIERLAGQKFAFSVICSAHPLPRSNYYAVHYAQGGPVALMVHDLPVAGEDLAGISTLSDTHLRAIETEVNDLCRSLHTNGKGPISGDLVAVRDQGVEEDALSTGREKWEWPLSADEEPDSSRRNPDPSSSTASAADRTYTVEGARWSDGVSESEELAGEGIFRCGYLTDAEYELLDKLLAWAEDEELASASSIADLHAACDCEEDIDHPQALDALYTVLEYATEQQSVLDLTSEQEQLLENLFSDVAVASGRTQS